MGGKERLTLKSKKECKGREEEDEGKRALCHEHIREPSPISGEKRERELPQRQHSKTQALRRSCHVGRIDQQACYF